MKAFIRVSENGQEQLPPEAFAALGEMQAELNETLAELSVQCQKDFDRCNFMAFIKKTPQLAPHEKQIIAGMKYIAESSGMKLQDAIDKANRHIGASFDEKMDHFFEYILKVFCNRGLMTVRRTLAEKPLIFESVEFSNMLLYIQARMAHYISLLKDDPNLQQVMITPMRYQLIMNCLESISVIASFIEPINENQSKLAFAVYDISCNLILPFFEHRFFVVSAFQNNSNKSDRKTKKNNIVFRLTPADLKGEPAAMRVRYADWYVYHDKNQPRAIEVIEPVEIPYCAQNVSPSEKLQQQLRTDDKKYRAEFKSNKKVWLAVQKKNSATCSIDLKLKIATYSAWVKIELFSKNANLALVLSYIQQLQSGWRSLKKQEGSKVVVPDIAQYYVALADLYDKRNQSHRVAQCLELASELHDDMTEQFNRGEALGAAKLENIRFKIFKKQKNETKVRLKEMRKESFDRLVTGWKVQKSTFENCIAVHFNVDDQAMTIQCQNIVSTKAYARQCKFAQLDCHVDDKKNLISISGGYKLTAKRLNSICYRAEKEMAYKKRKIIERLATQRREQELAKEQAESIGSKDHVTYLPHSMKSLYKNGKTGANKKSLAYKEEPLKVSAVCVVRKPIDWSAITEDDVYPIPGPGIQSCGMIKDVYFGYIPEDLTDEFEDAELIQRFESQLELGHIARKGDAQGIRSITGEVEDDDSDYIFKINIGREDLRLYGREVARQDVDGVTKILVCFDQLVGHKQTLKNVQKDNSNLSTLEERGLK